MATGGRPAHRVLVVQPDPSRARELRDALVDLRAEVQVVADAETAWRTFARFRPTHVIAALRAGERGGDWFLRRLQGEYLGAMPEVFLTCAPDDLHAGQAAEPDAFVILPVARSTIAALLGAGAGFGDSSGRQATRLRELYELSLLGPDLLQELDTLVARTSLAFQVSDCVVWGPSSEPYWPRTTRTLSREEGLALLARCRTALSVGTTVVVSSAATADQAVCDGWGQSLLAAPLGPPGEQPVAGICLVSDDARRYSNEERDSLRVLARRLSTELAWMSAHNRLVVEHEKLRQAALLDPLLGVWTRAALEQAIDSQLSAVDRRPALALAALDLKQLRAINDRYGHVVGDAVLAHFANVLSSSMRAQDQVGRFGGDELAVLFVGAELGEAKELTAAIVETLRDSPFDDAGLVIPLEVSVGLTSIEPAEASGDGAFARALGAVNRSSRSGQSISLADPRVDSSDAVPTVGTSQSLPAGSTLGGMYRILHEISRGAMGVVYRGEDLGLGRQVAIKVLRSDLASDRQLVQKFRAEAALLASQRHRNLVQVYSFGTEGEDVFFVMELVEGEPLSKIIQRSIQSGSFIDLDAVAKIVEEIAEALDALHAIGIVHRDVKPENVLVDRINDRAVLVDVGIARQPDDARDAAGTPGYAAPECFMEADETAATDVYGLAATTYAMLVNKAPYSGDELVQVVNQQLSEPPERPSNLRDEVAIAVDQVLTTAMAPEQNQRYRSATAFAIALTRALRRPPEARKSRPATVTTDETPRTDTFREESTYRLATPVTPEAGTSELGHSRGALFRVVAVTLGHRLGADWLNAVASADDAIRELLKPALAPTSWQPVEHLLWLLRCTDGHTEDPHELARDLGQAIMSATLARFFGADPSTQSPGSLLKAAESYWRRYHSWGHLAVFTPAPEGAILDLAGAPSEPLLCSLLAGTFARIAELAGARDVSCHIDACVSHGDPHCRFLVTWSATAAA